jgi:hypothetical protein
LGVYFIRRVSRNTSGNSSGNAMCARGINMKTQPVLDSFNHYPFLLLPSSTSTWISLKDCPNLKGRR